MKVVKKSEPTIDDGITITEYTHQMQDQPQQLPNQDTFMATIKASES